MYSVGNILWVLENSVPYKSKVVEVKEDPGSIKVHFVGYNAKFDTWLLFDSPRIVDPPSQELSLSQPSVSARGGKQTKKRSLSASGIDGSDSARLRKRSHVEVSESEQPNQEQNAATESRPDAFQFWSSRDSAAAAPTVSPVNVPVAALGTVSPTSSVGGRALSCTLCSMELGSGGTVKCGGCPSIFHAAVSCLGVEQPAVQALLDVKSGAIRYFCCICRQKASSDPGGSDMGGQAAMQQILTMIGSLVADFNKLADKVNRNADSQNKNSEGLGQIEGLGEVRRPGPPALGVSREQVLVEVREMYERDKRKSSSYQGTGGHNCAGSHQDLL